MTTLNTVGRKVALALVCALLAACTQTASSSYNGNLTDTSYAASEKKREAARARAAKRKEARREAFLKKLESQRVARTKAQTAKKTETLAAKRAAAREEKRQAAREARKQARAERLAKRNGKTTLRRTGKKTAKKTVTKRKPKVVAKARKSVKTVKTAKKGRVQKVAPTKAAYAPGAARRISTNGKPWNCVPGRLKAVLADVSKRFGAVTVNSTHRSGSYNRKIGGKRGSYHLKCAAVDFRVRGKTKGLTRYLAMHPKVGGYKRYRSGFYHIDTGPKRTW